ncbi:MAG: hypothetical protein JW791_01785 [Nanoarchaeota archaeon]|nr:hypothetical protein [Nanoarchaeota archaeon]
MMLDMLAYFKNLKEKTLSRIDFFDEASRVINEVSKDYNTFTIEEKKELLIDVLAFYDSVWLKYGHTYCNRKLDNADILTDLAMNNTLSRASADLKFFFQENTTWQDFVNEYSLEKLSRYGKAVIALKLLEYASEEIRTKFIQKNPELYKAALKYMKIVYETIPDNCKEEIKALGSVKWTRLNKEENKLADEKKKNYFGELRRF